MKNLVKMCSYYGKVCNPNQCDAEFCSANKFDYSVSFDQFMCEHNANDLCIKIAEYCNQLHCPLLKE
jgi:hypothetical protein